MTGMLFMTGTFGLVLAVALAVPTGAFAVETQGCDGDAIRISVTSEEPAVGSIRAELYGGDPALFLEDDGKLQQIAVPVTENATEVCFPVSDAGTYAVSLFHDVNDDAKLDRNFVGLPTEPWGISNDPPFKMRKPTFEEASFDVPEGGTDIEIPATVKP